MRLEHQILAAAAIDLALGDPRWLPHPVRAIGGLAGWLECAVRRLAGNGSTDVAAFSGATSGRMAGLLTALAVYTAAGLAAWGLVRGAGLVHPWAADAAAIYLIYSTIAARDLAAHAWDVLAALSSGDLPEARRRLGRIVGRDTERLDAPGVVRAAVESVAESTVDGVTAPVFYATLFGPVGAVVYRAVNTLDSMFGHRDDRYRDFGWAAARIDDAANYLPARLTAPLVAAAAVLLGLRPVAALKTLARDGRKHPSPNAGLTEAAMAGALAVQLGGPSYYDGVAIDKPLLGEPQPPPDAARLREAVALMLATAGLFLALCLAARAGLGWFYWEVGSR